MLQTTTATVAACILCLLSPQHSNAIVPFDLHNKGELQSGRIMDYRSKHHTPITEVMEQFKPVVHKHDNADAAMRHEAMSMRYKRDMHETEDKPEFFTHDFDDPNLYAIPPAYAGIENSEVVFFFTYDITTMGIVSNLYRSTDYGETFENINARVGNGASLIPTINIGPTNHRIVWMIDANAPIIYVSTDEGDTFTARPLTPGSIDPSSITPHATEDDWFMARDPFNSALYVSRDLGSTPCMKIADNVTVGDSVQWGEYPYDEDLSTIYFLSNKVFYYQQYPYGPDNQKRFGDAMDFNDFLVLHRYIYLQSLVNTSTTLYKLYMSADRKPFQEAKLPREGQYRYHVAPVQTSQALLLNRHENGEYVLYLSDESGVYFTESLASVFVIEVVPDRVYYIDAAASMNYTTLVANQVVSVGSFALRTLISFNAGGSWHLVDPPNGTAACPGCSLHFHIQASPVSEVSLYNTDSAPGILLALGAVGPFFNPFGFPDLYVSRDGGFTWSLALPGPWVVRILDHGSLIVAAPYPLSTENGSTLLMYSCDEGQTWSSFDYIDTPVHVAKLFSEPYETTTTLGVYGVKPNTTDWVVSIVDFRNVFPAECEDNDYYDWTPYDEYAPTGCFLGAEITIERRKSDVCCLNNHTYTRVIDYKICECTLEDFRCDYGFRPISFDVNACTRDHAVDFDDCANGEPYYNRSLGYRKGNGNLCIGGIEGRFVPDNLTCPAAISSETSSSTSYLAPFIVMLVLLIIALVANVGLIIVVIMCAKSKQSGVKSSTHEQFDNTSTSYSENEKK